MISYNSISVVCQPNKGWGGDPTRELVGVFFHIRLPTRIAWFVADSSAFAAVKTGITANNRTRSRQI
jgi:hypothetical protein